jgi:zinc protease
MKLRTASLLAALLSASTQFAPLHGQSAPKRGQPAPPRAVPDAPAIRSFTTKNGLRTTLIHVGTANRATVSLVLQTGEIDEPAFGPGLAALTADMLLQGSVARSARQIATESAALGTKIDVRAGAMTTSVSGDVESANLPHLLSLLADLVRHPLLDTASFGRARRHALLALDTTLHNPSELAKQQWRAIIFPEGPFGHPFAIASTLGLLQLGHVRNVYDDNYAASRAHLYVSGVFDDAAIEKEVREIYSDWTVGLPAKPRTVRSVTVHELVTLDHPGAERSVVWIGLPVIDPADKEFAKLEVADMLLAGEDSSRLSGDIADLEGTPPHSISSIWTRRSASYWVAEFNVRTANTGAAIEALFKEIGEIKREAPQERWVARARNRLIADFDARNNSRDGLVSMMEFMDEHSLGDGWRANYVRNIKNVTREDVRDAVIAYLEPRKMAVSIVGDRVAIEPQLVKLRPTLP